MKPSRHNSLHRRSSHSSRGKHDIFHGHPYECTPALKSIFEVFPSPSHSQVSKIMQQTGLKRKQITSWFWRKRKESIDPDSIEHAQFPRQSSSVHHDQTTAPTSSLPRSTIRYGKPRDKQNEEYRPPSYVQIKRRSSRNPSSDLNHRSSSQPHKARHISIHDQRASTGHSMENQTTISSNVILNSKPPLESCPLIASPERSPLLIRCKLRPLAQRVLDEKAEQELDEDIESKSPCGPLAPATPGHPSDFIPYPASHTTKDSSSPSGIIKDLTSSSAMQHDESRSILPSTSGNEVLREPFRPYRLPTNACDHHASIEPSRPTPASSSAIPPNQGRSPSTNLNIRESTSDIMPVNAFSPSRGDLCQYQLGSTDAPSFEEYSISATRSIVSGKNGWLRPEPRLSHRVDSQVKSISRNLSDAFRECSPSSTNSDTSTQMDAGQGVCLRVSPEDLDNGWSRKSSTSSLGHEIHRWSELSDVDGASRYSSESNESRASRCTNSAIEDYSALLGSSSDQVLISAEELRAAEEEVKSRDDRHQTNLSIGAKSISNPHHPMELATKTLPAFHEHHYKQLSFSSSTPLLAQQSEVEEDPRLFMFQGDNHEFFDLLDWNPLESFLSGAY
ncbi:hypothetical protein MJO28_012463 [Puccinia striiformis f. sp. tritici]|uniref:Uncharacterized protein n=1 Tax=Puccinia striiformis f. sp. tritici TaxID=168172 RepID=A0ACC0E1B0_9BASI|nr:hypothetical protein MJO28_012463 [Puccinia striiformis f. sp. tritici]